MVIPMGKRPNRSLKLGTRLSSEQTLVFFEASTDRSSR